MRFRRIQYVLLALLFAIMLNGCSTANADVDPAEGLLPYCHPPPRFRRKRQWQFLSFQWIAKSALYRK